MHEYIIIINHKMHENIIIINHKMDENIIIINLILVKIKRTKLKLTLKHSNSSVSDYQ